MIKNKFYFHFHFLFLAIRNSSECNIKNIFSKLLVLFPIFFFIYYGIYFFILVSE